ncbi:MAG: hypothetical protein AAEJ04_08065 [Planctomycetota bacterium]
MASARRRPPRSGSRRDKPESSNDGSRPSFQPPAKKGAGPVTVIITLVLFIGSAIFFAYALVNRGGEKQVVIKETTTDSEYKEIQRRIQKSSSLAREVVQLRNDPDTDRFVRKWTAANKYAGDTFDQLRAMLADVRLPNGTLPPSYSGYNKDFARLQIIVGDLIKVAPLDVDWESEE